MIAYKHKHIYVYQYELSKRKPYVGWEQCQYTLCMLLESMLRIVCGHMPKSVKFLHEKTA